MSPRIWNGKYLFIYLSYSTKQVYVFFSNLIVSLTYILFETLRYIRNFNFFQSVFLYIIANILQKAIHEVICHSSKIFDLLCKVRAQN